MRSLAVAFLLTLAIGAAAHGLNEPVDIEVLEPADRGFVVQGWPVSVGVVLPEGELTNPSDVRLVTASGDTVACDMSVTDWWDAEHTSIKWLLLEFEADADKAYRLIDGGANLRREAGMVTQQGGAVTVDTGPLQVTLREGSGKLFDAVTIDGQSIGGAEQVLTITYAPYTTAVREWSLAVEQSTPRRAVIHATGYAAVSWQQRLAKLDVRYHFFRGHRFVRVEHTLTWMVQNPRIGVREYAVTFAPGNTPGNAPGSDKAQFAVGGAGAWNWRRGDTITAHQHEATRFITSRGDDTLAEGDHFAGWAQVSTSGGVGIAVAIRDAWQMYPTAFELREDGTFIAALWPRTGPAMGFMYEDLMPPAIFNHTEWSRYVPKDVAHMTNEWQDNPYFMHTAEGAARTNELTFLFQKRDRTVYSEKRTCPAP